MVLAKICGNCFNERALDKHLHTPTVKAWDSSRCRILRCNRLHVCCWQISDIAVTFFLQFGTEERVYLYTHAAGMYERIACLCLGMDCVLCGLCRRYHLFGPHVSIANLMETLGSTDYLHVTRSFAELLNRDICKPADFDVVFKDLSILGSAGMPMW